MGGHVAGHAALDDDRRARDGCLHDGAFADGERLLGGYLAFDLPLDAAGSLEHQLARDPRSLAEERVDAAGPGGLAHDHPISLAHCDLLRCDPARARAGCGRCRDHLVCPLLGITFLCK